MLKKTGISLSRDLPVMDSRPIVVMGSITQTLELVFKINTHRFLV